MDQLTPGLDHLSEPQVSQAHLDSFAAFLTQPDTVDYAHDGFTIDTTASFSLDSWLFTHQISSYGKRDFLPLAFRLTFRTTLALRQEVPRPNEYTVTPDLFHCFFFSIAARTITALTVMRSGRKLRHLGIVGGQPKTKANTKHKPNTQKPNNTTKRLPKKARNRVKRCETYRIATLKL